MHAPVLWNGVRDLRRHLQGAVRDVVEGLRGLNDVAASIIGASTMTSDQNAIDAIMDRPDLSADWID